MTGEVSGAIGRYEIVRSLGRGGMAETFAATRRGPGGFEQRVCVKRILPALQGHPEFVDMFMREARIAAALRHTNIVQVYDFGTSEDGVLYMALELVDGLDLRTLLRAADGRRLAPELVAYLATELASALEHAHGARVGERTGVIHRDISPSNVLVSTAGEVKLADFGIALAVSGTRLTRTGVVKGKISYMAPEYALSGRCDEKSDLFALGVTLYEALAGRRPYDGETELDTLQRIKGGEHDPLGALVPDAPQLCDAIERLIAPDPAVRFSSAAGLLDALVEAAPSLVARRALGRLVQHAREARTAQEDEGRAGGDEGHSEGDDGRAGGDEGHAETESLGADGATGATAGAGTRDTIAEPAHLAPTLAAHRAPARERTEVVEDGTPAPAHPPVVQPAPADAPTRTRAVGRAQGGDHAARRSPQPTEAQARGQPARGEQQPAQPLATPQPCDADAPGPQPDSAPQPGDADAPGAQHGDRAGPVAHPHRSRWLLLAGAFALAALGAMGLRAWQVAAGDDAHDAHDAPAATPSPGRVAALGDAATGTRADARATRASGEAAGEAAGEPARADDTVHAAGDRPDAEGQPATTAAPAAAPPEAPPETSARAQREPQEPDEDTSARAQREPQEPDEEPASPPNRPQRAVLRVSVVPFGKVWIDGQLRGRAPLRVVLRPGRYRVAAGVAEPDVERPVRLEAGERRRVVLERP